MKDFGAFINPINTLLGDSGDVSWVNKYSDSGVIAENSQLNPEPAWMGSVDLSSACMRARSHGCYKLNSDFKAG